MEETKRGRMLEALARAVGEAGFVAIWRTEFGTQAIPIDGKNCPVCSSTPQEHKIVNVDPVTRLGEVHCTRCTALVRIYDPT